MPLARRRGSILVIEDDRDTRDLFTTSLKAAGFHVIAVSDGVEALRALDTATPALIVLDLGLPRLSGRDVAREIAARADTRAVPVVVVTGLDADGLPATVPMTVLRKPIDPELLVRTVERRLRGGAAAL